MTKDAERFQEISSWGVIPSPSGAGAVLRRGARRDRAAGSRRQRAPWAAFIEARHHTAGGDFIRIGGFDAAQRDMYIQRHLGASSVRVRAADLDFIAQSRQNKRCLVAEIRRLQASTQGRNTSK